MEIVDAETLPRIRRLDVAVVDKTTATSNNQIRFAAVNDYIVP